ncbi:TPA: hypothetical protein N0F65_008967 [Lagenidium giganteum]|uniref:Glycosyl hydrolase n=1 Tax=Lagenidium giganteum TaxID=4803 RepID=A0AAV2YUC3_9STRA|nr:TPA: hypothetical protein N0F65_008967 [Lagenidium giganteum]
MQSRLSTASSSSLAPRSSSVRASMTAPPQLAGGLTIKHGHFVDQHGRVQILRGVNLGGSSKLPTHYQHKGMPDAKQFFDGARSVSFVNRPFPLEEADKHFARLQRWGLTFLRFIVTWEAIEHEGPGIYDREYLEYIKALVLKAQDYGLLVYVDPHQDVWSRWTGGDGAPMWTLECVGLEPRNFEATKAALCVETYGGSVSDYPNMIWPTNYFKFACATMFTLFWSGKRFAPSCHVNGVHVQEILQSHYLNAMSELAKVLAGAKNVVGFGTMNEPSSGFIGLDDLSQHYYKGELKYDLAPTPFQGMVLADGIKQTIEVWSNGVNQHVLKRPDSHRVIDPNGVRAWKDGHRCVWKDEGIWCVKPDGTPKLLKPDHFAGVEFGRDFYVPFAAQFAERMRSILPNTLLFVELPPLEFSIGEFPEIDSGLIPRTVNATHWYDGVTLFLRAWRPYFTVDPQTKWPTFGFRAVQRLHQQQLAHIQEFGRVQMHGAPTLIGETGIPFNMNDGSAYRTGDYSAQIDAMDNTLSCLEANLLSYTLWCYTSDNCNQYGDVWNLEDLSLISIDKQEPPAEPGDNDSSHELMNDKPESELYDTSEDDACARALVAFVRPHAVKIAGIPTVSRFQLDRKEYKLEYSSDVGKMSEHTCEPTEVYVPHVHYPLGYTVSVSGGKYDVQSYTGWDIVHFHHDEKHRTHMLRITTNDPRVEERRRRRELRHHAVVILILLFLLGLLVVSM